MGTYRASPTCATGLPYSNAAVASLQPGEMPARCSRCSAPSGTFSTAAPQLAQPQGQYHRYPMDVHEHSTGIHRHQFQVCPAPLSQHQSPRRGIFLLFLCHPLGFASTPLMAMALPLPTCSEHFGDVPGMPQHHTSANTLILLPAGSTCQPPGPKRGTPTAVKNSNFPKGNPGSRHGSSGKNHVSVVSLGTARFGACRRQGLDEGALCQPHMGSLQAPSSAALVSRGIPLSKCSPPSPCIVLWLCRGISHSPTSLRWRQAGSLASRLYLERGLISQRML